MERGKPSTYIVYSGLHLGAIACLFVRDFMTVEKKLDVCIFSNSLLSRIFYFTAIILSLIKNR